MVTGTLGYVIGRWIMKRREEGYGQEWKTEPAQFALVRQ
jgi:hypothetical protein